MSTYPLPLLRSLSYSALFVIFFALGLAACGGGHDVHEAIEPPAVRAEIASAQRVTLPELVELQGTVVADRETTLSARISARVTAVRVRDGAAVDRGQRLLEIDPQAAAGEEARARGALAQAEAALALAERNYHRFQDLANKEAASEIELDTASSHYRQSQAAVEQAKGAVAAAASVAADARVSSPFAARVSRVMVEIGDLVNPGRPLITLQSRSGRRLRLYVPERVVSLSGLAIGSEIELAIDSRPDLGGAGEVVEMTPGADPGSHSYRVEVTLDRRVPTGLIGRGRLRVGSREAVLVPSSAVIRQGGLELVALRGADGRAATRAVTTGERLDGEVEVLSGLLGGEEVLLGLERPPLTGSPIEIAAGASEQGGPGEVTAEVGAER